MILHKTTYVKFITARGVGAKDVVASSPASYVSYLNSVSRHIGEDIGPDNLRTEQDVILIANRIIANELAAERTVGNYRSAMRQYVAMVLANGL